MESFRAIGDAFCEISGPYRNAVPGRPLLALFRRLHAQILQFGDMVIGLLYSDMGPMNQLAGIAQPARTRVKILRIQHVAGAGSVIHHLRKLAAGSEIG